MKNVLLVIAMFMSLYVNGQKKVEEISISNVQGVAYGSENESPAQVKQRAINEAKIEALKQAGIAENIALYTDYFQSENNEKYDELFASDILSDIRGSVKNVELLDAKNSFDNNVLKVEVKINCVVLKYLSERDLTFDFKVEGVGLFYPNETDLIFTVEPSKDAYLKVFIFSETEAFQLFPNKTEKSYLLVADTKYNFPSELMEYELYTDKKSEVHRMIMVLMKEDIPYYDEVEYKNIIDWIYSIPPDMRAIESSVFSVVQENKMKEN